MGFSWRGKTSAQPVTPDDAGAEATATGLDGAEGRIEQLGKFRRQHQWDPFLDVDKLDTVDNALRSGDAEKSAAIEESLIEEDSPYPEVRSSVRPIDDPDMPVNTIRAWTIGFTLCTIIAACNILLGLRRAPIFITSTVVQLVAYP